MGTLQYKKRYDTIKHMVIPRPNYTEEQYTLGYTVEVNSDDHVKRLTPNTKMGKQQWELVLVMKKVEHGVTHLKGALLNRTTQEIALMTTFSDKHYIIDHGNRAIKSLDDQYFIGHYRLLAPLYFWNELKTRLNQD
jgi:hypothetical protein